MSPRGPSTVLVVDTNILLAMLLGRQRNTDRLRRLILSDRDVVATEHTRTELIRVYAALRPTPMADSIRSAEAVLESVQILPMDVYSDRMAAAATCLRLAVPSRNGSTGDAHILALAWHLDADIWSGDRDFAGTGWPSWSSANLYRAIIPDGDWAGPSSPTGIGIDRRDRRRAHPFYSPPVPVMP